MGELLAVLHEGGEVLEEGHFAADLLEFDGVEAVGVAEEVGGGFGLGACVVGEELGLEVILVAAEAPIAEVIFVEVSAGGAEGGDDLLIRDAVVEHEVNLVAQGGGQACDFAVAPGVGLAGLEPAGEVVFGGIGEKGGSHSWLRGES